MDVNRYFRQYSDKIEELGFKAVAGTNFSIQAGLKVNWSLFRDIHYVAAEAFRKAEMFLSFYKIDAMRSTYFWEDLLLFLNLIIIRISDSPEIKVSISKELRSDFLSNLTNITNMAFRENDILKSRAKEALINYLVTFYSKEIIDRFYLLANSSRKDFTPELKQLAHQAMITHLKSFVFIN